MRCDECREAISAGLDGEELPGEDAAVAAHLEGCPECRWFAERAARVTRLTRTRAAEPAPDLTAALVAAAPQLRRRSAADAVRVALGAVGIAQLALAVSGMVGGDAGAHHGEVQLAGASVAHLANESAAWNVALAIGFLWAAVGAARLAGLLPVLAAFVGVLAALSVLDAVAGRVDADRLLSHGLVVLGFVLLLVLARVRGGDGGAEQLGAPTGRRAVDRSGSDLRRHPDDDGGLRPTARRRAA